MLRLGRPAAGLIAAGSLLMAAGPATASSSARPFTATLAGQVAMPTPSTGVFEGSGQATHLGRISTDGDAVITGPSSSCPQGLANVHVETLTAANGDTLTITSQDVACPVAMGQFVGSGHWTVTGGTGRFSGATGAGSFAGTLDLVTGTFDITLTGTIDYGR